MVNEEEQAMQATLDAGQSISATYPDVLNMIYILMTLTISLSSLLQLFLFASTNLRARSRKRFLKSLKNAESRMPKLKLRQ